MMINAEFLIDPFVEVLHLNQRGIFEDVLFRVFIGQPDFTGPEAVGPVLVDDRLIE